MPETTLVRYKRLSYHSIGLAVTCVVAAVASIPLFFTPRPLISLPPYLIFYSNFDSFNQRLAHKIFLVLLAFFALFSPWLRTCFSNIVSMRTVAIINVLSSSFKRVPLLFFFLLSPLFVWLYQGEVLYNYLFGMLFFAVLFLFSGNYSSIKYIRNATIAISISIFIFLIFSGFWWPVAFLPEVHSDGILMHYYGFFGLAPLLASGGDLFANKLVFYGVLIQTILAIRQKILGIVQIGDYVLLVQISQVIFTFLSFICYRCFRPISIFRTIFCIGLWLPWVTTSGMSILYPTQSGLRFMNFPVAILAMLCTLRMARYSQALFLGLIAGATLLYNLETGICCTFTFIMYNVVKEKITSYQKILLRLLVLVFGCIIFFIIYIVMFRFGLGRWPLVSSGNIFYFINLFLSGFGGLPLRFDPLAAFIILYPAYLLTRLTPVWFKGRLSDQMRMKFLVSFLLLVWMAYYFNRAHDWNLWTYIYLFTFILIDIIPSPYNILKTWKGFKTLIHTKVPGIIFPLVFILGPSLMNKGIVEINENFSVLNLRYAIQKSDSSSKKLSNIWYSSPCADGLAEKIDYLRNIQNKKIFFSASNQFLLQVQTGIFFPLPFQDLFVESIDVDAFNRNVDALTSMAPDIILLDNRIDCQGWLPERQSFNDYLLKKLNATYKQTDEIHGWRRLERLDSTETQQGN